VDEMNSANEKASSLEPGVSEDFLHRLERSGASDEFVERLRRGGTAPRSRIIDSILSNAPDVGFVVALAAGGVLGGGSAAVVSGAVAAVVSVIIRYLENRSQDDQIVVPPVERDDGDSQNTPLQ
jgi:hypothetical protein